jgi:hypothetical protein
LATGPAKGWYSSEHAPLPEDSYRLELGGLVGRPLPLTLAELQTRDRLMATLDCTRGFYSRQRCSGLALRPAARAGGPQPGGTHVRVISHTGYRWRFELRDARGLLGATGVGAEPLSHEHGAPARLGQLGSGAVRDITFREASQEERASSSSAEIACKSSPSRPNGRPGRASSRRSCKGRLTLAIASAPRRRRTEDTGRRADTGKRSPE